MSNQLITSAGRTPIATPTPHADSPDEVTWPGVEARVKQALERFDHHDVATKANRTAMILLRPAEYFDKYAKNSQLWDLNGKPVGVPEGNAVLRADTKVDEEKIKACIRKALESSTMAAEAPATHVTEAIREHLEGVVHESKEDAAHLGQALEDTFAGGPLEEKLLELADSSSFPYQAPVVDRSDPEQFNPISGHRYDDLEIYVDELTALFLDWQQSFVPVRDGEVDRPITLDDLTHVLSLLEGVSAKLTESQPVSGQELVSLEAYVERANEHDKDAMSLDEVVRDQDVARMKSSIEGLLGQVRAELDARVDQMPEAVASAVEFIDGIQKQQESNDSIIDLGRIRNQLISLWESVQDLPAPALVKQPELAEPPSVNEELANLVKEIHQVIDVMRAEQDGAGGADVDAILVWVQQAEATLEATREAALEGYPVSDSDTKLVYEMHDNTGWTLTL